MKVPIESVELNHPSVYLRMYQSVKNDQTFDLLNISNIKLAVASTYYIFLSEEELNSQDISD